MKNEFDWEDKKQRLVLIFIVVLMIIICSIFISPKDRFYWILIMMLIVPLFIGVIIFERILKKKIKKDIAKYGLSEEDFKWKNDYYRDILKISSPLIIGFIDDMQLEISEKEWVAELLYLKNKNVIDFQDGKIVKLNKENTEELLMCDRLF